MSVTIKILTLENEIEAQLLSSLLEQNNIPHMIRNYHDLALDGLWQTQSAWGHVEAPEQYSDEIQRIYNEMSRPGNIEEII